MKPLLTTRIAFFVFCFCSLSLNVYGNDYTMSSYLMEAEDIIDKKYNATPPIFVRLGASTSDCDDLIGCLHPKSNNFNIYLSSYGKGALDIIDIDAHFYSINPVNKFNFTIPNKNFRIAANDCNTFEIRLHKPIGSIFLNNTIDVELKITFKEVGSRMWITEFFQLTFNICEGQKPLRLKVDNEDTFKVFPNPSKDFINIGFISKENKNHRLSILNSFGVEIEQLNFTSDKGINRKSMDIVNLPQGIYWVYLEDELGNNQIKSFLKQ